MKHETSTVTTKGQLVIPSRLRRKYGIRQGTKIVFVEGERHLILQPLTREFLDGLCGWLKGRPSPLEYLLAERKRERKL
jgi:AbrB family looped-hinge helix DNA binding protein